jgi:hypothetical protein
MKLKLLPLICPLACLVFFTSGCSLLVLRSGLEPKKVFTKDSTTASIQKRLGKPIARYTDIPQIEIPEPEFPNRLFHNVPDRTHAASAAAREDYRYRGYVTDPITEAGYSMGIAMTFGLYEVLAFPQSIAHVASYCNDVHYFSVWYDENGKFAAVRTTMRESIPMP